jgi:hypothetical protein
MIIEFSVGNYASFKDPVTLSLVAARSIKSRNRALDAENLIPVDTDLSLLAKRPWVNLPPSRWSSSLKADSFVTDFLSTQIR